MAAVRPRFNIDEAPLAARGRDENIARRPAARGRTVFPRAARRNANGVGGDADEPARARF